LLGRLWCFFDFFQFFFAIARVSQSASKKRAADLLYRLRPS
jgi:hypothetical protein